tara:strand:- start:453 stop:629 length:177 start_codon:yes stop_codon:yes gene_type:complete
MIAINQKKFFQKIFLDDDGNMIIIFDEVVNPINKGFTQKNTFQKSQLTNEGYLKTYKS